MNALQICPPHLSDIANLPGHSVYIGCSDVTESMTTIAILWV